MTQKLTLLRLQKEQASIERQPIPNAIVTREGILNFHFCLYNLQGHYKDGLYYGLFQLHQNYPFNAPKLYFYTPSGRFEINVPICTSFTHYHQETWTSAWNVRSLILATISFMYSEEPSYGCRSDSESSRRQYARNSKEYNFTHIANFSKLFGKKLVQVGQITDLQLSKYTKKDKVAQQAVPQKEPRQQKELQQPLILNQQKSEQNDYSRIENVQNIRQLLMEQPIGKNQPRKQNNNNHLKRAILKGLGCAAIITIGVVLYYRFR